MPVPYINPYYFQNNPAYPPQYNPLTPYQDRLNQMQNQFAQPQQFNSVPQTQTPVLNGEVVDGIDVVKAKNVDMSGNVTFYPKADLSEIYTKQLQSDGTSRIITYRAVQPEKMQEATQQAISIDMLNGMLTQLKQDLLREISGIKDMIPKQNSNQDNAKIQKGGWQK